MPTVVREGDLALAVHPIEKGYEPPHVHVLVGGSDICRINLLTAEFMDEPPPGRRRVILDLYNRHISSCWQEWVRCHGKGE